MTEPVIIWRRWPATGGPAVESPEPPVAAFDYRRLSAMADHMLKTRRERLPGDIAQNRVDEVEAHREIAAFEYLAANWRFIATGEGEPAGFGADHILRDALDASITTAAAFAGEAGGFSETLGAMTESAIALRWHLEPGRQTIALARLTHQLRAAARAANSSKEPAK